MAFHYETNAADPRPAPENVEAALRATDTVYAEKILRSELGHLSVELAEANAKIQELREALNEQTADEAQDSRNVSDLVAENARLRAEVTESRAAVESANAQMLAVGAALETSRTMLSACSAFGLAHHAFNRGEIPSSEYMERRAELLEAAVEFTRSRPNVGA